MLYFLISSLLKVMNTVYIYFTILRHLLDKVSKSDFKEISNHLNVYLENICTNRALMVLMCFENISV